MNELKLVMEDGAAADLTRPDLSKANPMDALNRRDIELIKRSLATMHKDCAELRSTIVALHGRQSRAPSKGFFLSLGVLAFVMVAGLSIARPQLDAALHDMPVMAKLSGGSLSP